MSIPIGSTTPITLGPLVSTSGTLVASAAVTLHARVNGVAVTPGGTLGNSGNTGADGCIEYTPSAADPCFATAGELRIVSSTSAAVWSQTYAVASPVAVPVVAVAGGTSPAVASPLYQVAADTYTSVAPGTQNAGTYSTLVYDDVAEQYTLTQNTYAAITTYYTAWVDGPQGTFGPIKVASSAGLATWTLLQSTFEPNPYGANCDWMPMIAEVGGTWYLTFNPSLGGNPSLAIYTSTNIASATAWTGPIEVPLPAPLSSGNVGPEWFPDQFGGLHLLMISFSGGSTGDTTYEMHPLSMPITSETEWSAPQKLFTTEDPTAYPQWFNSDGSISGSCSILYMNGYYWLTSSGAGQPFLMRSLDWASGWELYGPNPLLGLTAHENPTLTQTGPTSVALFLAHDGEAPGNPIYKFTMANFPDGAWSPTSPGSGNQINTSGTLASMDQWCCTWPNMAVTQSVWASTHLSGQYQPVSPATGTAIVTVAMAPANVAQINGFGVEETTPGTLAAGLAQMVSTVLPGSGTVQDAYATSAGFPPNFAVGITSIPAAGQIYVNGGWYSYTAGPVPAVWLATASNLGGQIQDASLAWTLFFDDITFTPGQWAIVNDNDGSYAVGPTNPNDPSGSYAVDPNNNYGAPYGVSLTLGPAGGTDGNVYPPSDYNPSASNGNSNYTSGGTTDAAPETFSASPGYFIALQGFTGTPSGNWTALGLATAAMIGAPAVGSTPASGLYAAAGEVNVATIGDQPAASLLVAGSSATLTASGGLSAIFTATGETTTDGNLIYAATSPFSVTLRSTATEDTMLWQINSGNVYNGPPSTGSPIGTYTWFSGAHEGPNIVVTATPIGGGLTTAEAAQLAAITAKVAQIGTGQAIVQTPVTAAGAKLQLVRNTDYDPAKGTALQWTDVAGTWPAGITGVTLTCRINAGDPDPPPLQAAGTIISTDPYVAQIEHVTAEATLDLRASRVQYDQSFDLVATLEGGDLYPIVPAGRLNVLQNVTGPR
jgi:hypothetical protein